jgi:hypothetical protein
MNHGPDDWNELARVWHAESAAISVDDIEGYLRRERARLRALAAAEFTGLGIAVALAAWAAWSTPFIWFSAGFLVFSVLTAWFARAGRDASAQANTEDLLASLRIGIEREQELVTRLGIGRLSSFVALGGVVFFLSQGLLRPLVPQGWLPVLLAAAAWSCAAIAWNLVLTARARRRKRRLETIAAQLKDAA